MKAQAQVGISGAIKVWITNNITGKKILVQDIPNAIQTAYAAKIVDMLQTNTDFTLADDMFNGNANPPPNGENGIAIKDGGGLWYEMIMSAPVVAAGWITFTGTFTGVGITVADAASVNLGHDYAAPFNTIIALPSAWASQAVGAGETLTIEWIIKHQIS